MAFFQFATQKKTEKRLKKGPYKNSRTAGRRIRNRTVADGVLERYTRSVKTIACQRTCLHTCDT